MKRVSVQHDITKERLMFSPDGYVDIIKRQLAEMIGTKVESYLTENYTENGGLTLTAYFYSITAEEATGYQRLLDYFDEPHKYPKHLKDVITRLKEIKEDKDGS